MGAFSRLRYVMAANANALLERAENPEKLLRALLRDMEEAEHALRRDMDQLARAELALQARRKRLPAVDQSMDQAADAETLQRVAAQQRALDEEQAVIEDQLRRLEQDRRTLAAKMTEARQLLQPGGQVKQVADKARHMPRSRRKLHRVLDRFDAFEHRLDHLESRVEVYDLDGQPELLTKSS